MLDFQNYRNQTGFITGTSYVPTKVNNNLFVAGGSSGASNKMVRPVVCPCKSSSGVEVGKLLDMALLKRQNLMMNKQTTITSATTTSTQF
ncbi:hypothetical protein C9374_008760 [Naegleria lovaniensis]|uniref:Uncharacterized protein n=1 Tax=Naegleria lovaniensis TaxID=51637 RepID=A0AA88GGK1_NAELO|nr:uncharacterized protein C9374_008760 [Naegleria lovaniensis]KAG2378138.1 hypothetical protein C9374_008760 [Naegleria lovaniensis]